MDLEIDRNRLDDEWVDQPKLYKNAAENTANARLEYNRAKAELEIAKAEIDREVRKNPERFGLSKVTETTVASAVSLHPRCKEAMDALITMKHELDVAEALVSALDHRKKALEDLVKLFLADYFAKPRAPQGAQEEVEEMTRKHKRRGRDLKR